MRLTSLLAVFLVGAFTLSVASAQPKRGRAVKPEVNRAAAAGTQPPPEPKGTPGGTPAGAEEATPAADPARAPAPADGADDLGAPPSEPADSPAEGKLSPLNPAADEFPAGGAAPPPVDFDRLLGDVAALRSRVSALTTALFKSKLRVIVETRGADARLSALVVTLDDGAVFVAPERFSAEDERIVYEHAVAPGQHVVGIDVERYDARGREYRTWQTSKFSVQVPDSRMVEAHFVLDDDSEMAADFPDDRDGQYDLRVRLRARVAE